MTLTCLHRNPDQVSIPFKEELFSGKSTNNDSNENTFNEEESAKALKRLAAGDLEEVLATDHVQWSRRGVKFKRQPARISMTSTENSSSTNYSSNKRQRSSKYHNRNSKVTNDYSSVSQEDNYSKSNGTTNTSRKDHYFEDDNDNSSDYDEDEDENESIHITEDEDDEDGMERFEHGKI